MSHLVPYWWFKRTQYIPQFGDVLQECGDFTWRVTDCEELVGVKSFLDNVQLVQLKKYGSKFIIVPVWDSFLSVYHKFGS